jgi:hypothetical protein
MSGEFVDRRGHLLDGVRDAGSVLGCEQRSVVEHEGLFCGLTSYGRVEQDPFERASRIDGPVAQPRPEPYERMLVQGRVRAIDGKADLGRDRCRVAPAIPASMATVIPAAVRRPMSAREPAAAADDPGAGRRPGPVPAN